VRDVHVSLATRAAARKDSLVIPELFIRRWQAAGLIDDVTAERIRAWEASHRRPVWLWAVAGMGALAVGLGVLAVIGANWENIPAGMKLAVGLGLNALCAAALFNFWRRKRAWAREVTALLLFALVLGGIALIGQVYQLQSPLWRALLLWLALCTPFLALTAHSQLVGAIWAVAAVTTWFTAEAPLHRLFEAAGIVSSHGNYLESDYFLRLLVYLPACGMIVVAMARRLWPRALDQGNSLLRLALAGLMVAVTLSVVFDDLRDDGWLRSAAAAAGATLLAAASQWLERDASKRRPVLMLLGVSFAVWLAALLTADVSGRADDIVRALLFIGYWAAIGGMAARAGHRGLFGLAFSVIGLRLLILYFEAIGGLTATGLGLIGGGVLCIALASVGWRLTRGVSPPSAKAAS
jgi:uncharacterized membrane protein